jgi:hypothetical protein
MCSSSDDDVVHVLFLYIMTDAYIAVATMQTKWLDAAHTQEESFVTIDPRARREFIIFVSSETPTRASPLDACLWP